MGLQNKKGVVLTLFLLVFAVLLSANVHSIFSGGGSGTEDDPYQIASADHLREVADDPSAHYILTDDLNLHPSQTAQMWVPFNFSGTLDGDGHTISSLVQDSSIDSFGLFATLLGTVVNLRIVDADIVADSSAAILATRCEGCVVDNVVVQGEIDGTQSQSSDAVGGLFAFADRGQINSTYAHVTLDVVNIAGGLVGYIERTDIFQSSASGTMNGGQNASRYMGGLIGLFGYGSTLNESYAAVDLYGANQQFDPSALVAESSNMNERAMAAALVNSYASFENIIDPIGQYESGYGTFVTDAQLKDASTYAGWDFNTVWGFSSYSNDGYPILTKHVDYFRSLAPQGPTPNLQQDDQGRYLITSVADLDELRREYSSGFRYLLTTDLDFSSLQNWEPILVSKDVGTDFFFGEFDGNGKTIYNLQAPLFYRLKGDVKNLTISGAFITSQENSVGALTRQCYDRCDLNNIVVKNSFVASSLGSVGAIVGQMDGTGKHLAVYDTIVHARSSVGGIAGQLTTDGTFKESFSSAEVSGTEYVGGLVGTGGGITDSYALGLVSGTSHVGGLVGRVGFGMVERTFADVLVSAADSSTTDAFVGSLGDDSQFTGISDSYFVTQDSGVMTSSHTGVMAAPTGRELITYANDIAQWDDDTIWETLDEGGPYDYPVLRDLAMLLSDSAYADSIHPFEGDGVYSSDNLYNCIAAQGSFAPCASLFTAATVPNHCVSEVNFAETVENGETPTVVLTGGDANANNDITLTYYLNNVYQGQMSPDSASVDLNLQNLKRNDHIAAVVVQTGCQNTPITAQTVVQNTPAVIDDVKIGVEDDGTILLNIFASDADGDVLQYALSTGPFVSVRPNTHGVYSDMAQDVDIYDVPVDDLLLSDRNYRSVGNYHESEDYFTFLINGQEHTASISVDDEGAMNATIVGPMLADDNTYVTGKIGPTNEFDAILPLELDGGGYLVLRYDSNHTRSANFAPSVSARECQAVVQVRGETDAPGGFLFRHNAVYPIQEDNTYRIEFEEYPTPLILSPGQAFMNPDGNVEFLLAGVDEYPLFCLNGDEQLDTFNGQILHQDLSVSSSNNAITGNAVLPFPSLPGEQKQFSSESTIALNFDDNSFDKERYLDIDIIVSDGTDQTTHKILFEQQARVFTGNEISCPAPVVDTTRVLENGKLLVRFAEEASDNGEYVVCAIDDLAADTTDANFIAACAASPDVTSDDSIELPAPQDDMFYMIQHVCSDGQNHTYTMGEDIIGHAGIAITEGSNLISVPFEEASLVDTFSAHKHRIDHVQFLDPEGYRNVYSTVQDKEAAVHGASTSLIPKVGYVETGFEDKSPYYGLAVEASEDFTLYAAGLVRTTPEELRVADNIRFPFTPGLPYEVNLNEYGLSIGSFNTAYETANISPAPISTYAAVYLNFSRPAQTSAIYHEGGSQ